MNSAKTIRFARDEDRRAVVARAGVDALTDFAALLDLRCLQDPDYAGRGVGRHALAVLKGARQFGAVQVLGLIDPKLPAPPDSVRSMLDGAFVNGYAAHIALRSIPQRGVFVSLSPMTHDAAFAARLLNDASLHRVAVVYDFIPSREPCRYLSTLR